ncbi:MAG: cytochrome c-type biogenesis protein CcmH [Paracoccus sp. (in: a-proteobacteria)]|nr:cytochrome c-type biogenesis protein CcmH [Paracoccus sp. (in: a-proteobacteria)]
MRQILTVLTLIIALAAPGFAVQPDEVLDDPVLEQRARDLSRNIRCPVCQGENIDESNAPVSRDLRLYVRERLVEGDSDAEVVDAVTDRFGEYVLFEPRRQGVNLLLYWAGPVMAIIALLIGWQFLRSRGRAPEPRSETLSDTEKARLDEIMRR